MEYDLTHGEAVTILKSRTSSAENKLKALNAIISDEKLRTYNRLNKADMWLLCKFLYQELLKGYEDVNIAEKNPCYHCYLGAVNNCAGCDIHYEEWSKKLESPYYQKTVKFKNVIKGVLDGQSN